MMWLCSPGFAAVLPLIPASQPEATGWLHLCLSLFSKLALRAVNPSHSAYSCFLFSPLFFQRYKVGSGPSSVPFKCKLSMKVFSHLGTAAMEEADVLILPMCLFVCKSVLPLFRCLTSIERSVDQCQISVSSSLTDRVTVQFFCRHGTVSCCWRCSTDDQHLVAVFPNYHIVCVCVCVSQASLKPTTCTSRKVRPCRQCLLLISAPTCWSVLPG